MNAIVDTHDGARYVGTITETLLAGQPMLQIASPAVPHRLARTVMVNVKQVSALRVLDNAAQMQALVAEEAEREQDGDELDLLCLATGAAAWRRPGESWPPAANEPPAAAALVYAEVYVDRHPGPSPYLGRLAPQTLQPAPAGFLALELAETGQTLYIPLAQVVLWRGLTVSEYRLRLAEWQAARSAG